MPCILVVDGDGDTREALKAVLAGEGFDVRIAADGAEALVHASQPDKAAVVLLDEDLFEEMQGRPDLEGIPVVLMSSDRRRLRQPRCCTSPSASRNCCASRTSTATGEKAGVRCSSGLTPVRKVV